MLTARAPDLRRVYQYHGAEHMSIHALEAGDPLTTEAVRRYPTAHPRCGTEFLVVVLLVSIVAGQKIESLKSLAPGARVIRAMRLALAALAHPLPCRPGPGHRGNQL